MTTASHEIRPSPRARIPIPDTDEHGMSEEEALTSFLKQTVENAARVKRSSAPLMIPPERLLDFIDVWTKNPDTPLDDLLAGMPPGLSHVLSAFILVEKYKIDQAKMVRKELKEKRAELKKRALVISPQQFVVMQAEIRKLSKDYQTQSEHCCGVKDRFLNKTKQVLDDHNCHIATQDQVGASSLAPLVTQQASASMPLIEEIHTAAEDSTIPEETAMATEIVVPEENVGTTASVLPEITFPSASAAAETNSSQVKTIPLPSALEVKKTKVAEQKATKRKASALLPQESVKKVKLVSSFTNPIDAPPLASVPPSSEERSIVPFSEEYLVPSDDEESHSTASSEQVG
jgi:hypothetical protein